MQSNTIQALLQESFDKYSTKCAIEFGTKNLTYRELDTRANAVAAIVAAMDPAQSAVLGVLVDDRMDLITIIIGILKAGRAFMPLEPTYPEKRLETMIVSTGTRYIFTDENNLPFLKKLQVEGAQVIVAQKVWENQTSSMIPSWDYQPDDLIYIYFTSGTTGQPKAIAGRNKGLWHFVRWEIDNFKINYGSRVSQLTPPCHDPFLRDVFSPLCAGGTVCIPPGKEVLLDPKALSAWIDSSCIQLIHCTPSLFKVFNREGLENTNYLDLQYVLLAGERVISKELDKWYQVFGGRIHLVNLYGPTETTLAKLFYHIKPEDAKRTNIPIGKPMKGAAVIILNEKMKVCNLGEIGQIFIRTPYRSLGYYQDTASTLQKFIPNPFQDDPNDLIYMTGDLGRILPDGNIEFMGRMDRQVKIRGFRVEMSEIEGVLNKVPGISDSVVHFRRSSSEDGGTDEGILVAYYISSNPLDEEILRVALVQKLPEYMIPAHFMSIDRIPLTSNGKLNYEALPDPVQALCQDYVPPQNDIENRLEKIWREVLGLEKISLTAHFMQIGGHSLKLMTLSTRIAQEFGVEIPIHELYFYDTIRKIATYISEQVNAHNACSSNPIGDSPLPHKRIEQEEDEKEILDLIIKAKKGKISAEDVLKEL